MNGILRQKEKRQFYTSFECGMIVDLCGWRFELCRVGLIMLKPAIALAIIVEEQIIETDGYYMGWLWNLIEHEEERKDKETISIHPSVLGLIVIDNKFLLSKWVR